MKPSREELAWAAGFFDGEGNTHYGETNGHYRTPCVQVNVANTFRPVLERFQQAVGGIGRIYPQNNSAMKPHWKKRWQYSVASFEKAQAILAMLWPFLSEEKRAQAIDALEQYHTRQREKRFQSA